MAAAEEPFGGDASIGGQLGVRLCAPGRCLQRGGSTEDVPAPLCRLAACPTPCRAALRPDVGRWGNDEESIERAFAHGEAAPFSAHLRAKAQVDRQFSGVLYLLTVDCQRADTRGCVLYIRDALC
mmetsp:Transcript_102684/g.329105  ORF Transcript_102684/g.329105 Transcript_102684/m.329105 type:complete len:125 (-) Transcript_102684:130-504(-)